jgi:4-amino-4-deoxy-L-arabinose transferase-like glycosyltransferase
MPRVPPGLLAGLLGLTAFRSLLAATLPAGDDEAYYWEWSRHLAAGYIDHPPAVAYLVRASVWMFGQTPFAVHTVAVVLSLATSLALWTLAAEVTGRREAGTWTVFLYSVTPVFAAGSLLTAPDGPLFLCWAMTLLWTWRAARGTRLGPWLVAGAWLGLGLQSKYVAVGLLASLSLWLMLAPAGRRWLTRREPYAGLAVALVIFAPVVVWNAMHHWVSFALTALGTSRWTEKGNAAFFLTSQLAYIGPLTFAASIWALIVAAWRGIIRPDTPWLFLAAGGWPVILGATAGSLLVTAKPHWPAPGFMAAIIALAAILTEPSSPRGTSVRRWLLGVTAGVAGLTGAAFYMLPILTATVLPPTIDPAANYYGWAEAGPAIVEMARREARGPFFITADWYQSMAPFDFSTGGRVLATTLTGDDQYRFWTRLEDLQGWDGLFIRDSRQTYDVDLGQVCRALEPSRSVPLRRGHVVIREVDLVWCRGFAGHAVPRLAAFRWSPAIAGPPLRLAPGLY